jgi:glucosamine 6-phosphate synthetase-like amidotransferase/phosphosugar isomerase protein
MTEFLDGCYRAILAQRTAIPETLQNVEEKTVEDLQGRHRLVVVGCGDSYAVAEYGRWAFLHAGLEAVVLSALEIDRIPLDKNSVVIGVSASGRSIATVNALRDAKSKGALTVALTDNANGTVTEVADRVWFTKAGVDSYNISPSSPTTTAMAYILKLSALLRDDELLKGEVDMLVQKGDVYLDWAEKKGKEIAEKIPAQGHLYLISDGPNYVAGMIGMMKFNEYSLIKGIAALREEFAHHWVLSLTEDEHAILISDRPSTQDDDVYLNVLTETLGMNVYHFSTDTDLQLKSPYGQAIVNSIALQMAAYHHVAKHEPNKENWKSPHAGAFKIY